MRSNRLPLLTLVTALAALGCRRDPDADPTAEASAPSARGGGPQSLPPTASDALGPLARARCEREERCGRVGEGKAFTDEHQCSQAVRLVDESTGFLRRCSTRIDVRTMDACVEAVARSSCEDVGLTLSGDGPCQPSALCRGY